ncbi:hypothetical protein OUZ56_013179 [Daphnia magna]|uniref:Uncharacterized protein n=1 Tax=Daphnia magna TaxID=35525 RepID=A0ABQ9Z5W5_9CRUS|nr:hypothetical protein OUZ56_013179 [Daphnia magna]
MRIETWPLKTTMRTFADAGSAILTGVAFTKSTYRMGLEPATRDTQIQVSRICGIPPLIFQVTRQQVTQTTDMDVDQIVAMQSDLHLVRHFRRERDKKSGSRKVTSGVL